MSYRLRPRNGLGPPRERRIGARLAEQAAAPPQELVASTNGAGDLESASKAAGSGYPQGPLAENSSLKDLNLPEELEAVVGDFSHRFGVSAISILPSILTVTGVAMGTSVLLETDLFAVPVNTCVHCAVLESGQELDSLVQAILQPLRDVQDQRISALNTASPKEIRAQIRAVEKERDCFNAGTLMRDPVAEASFAARIKPLQARLFPVLIIEGKEPGNLHKAVVRSFGEGLLEYRNSLMMHKALNAPQKLARDLDTAACAWENRTSETGIVESVKTAVPARPVVASLLHCDEQPLTRLLCSGDPVVRHFTDQLIITRPERAGAATTSGFCRVPESWRTLIVRLLANREPGQQRCFTLSSVASGLLEQYVVANQGAGSRGAKYAATLAAKLALGFHASSTQADEEISVAIIQTAMGVTNRLLKATAAAANQCIAWSQSNGIADKAAQMLKKIQTPGRISLRDLQRTYRKITIKELRRILDSLVASGQVRFREDGLVEAVPGSGASAEKMQKQ